MFLNYKEHFKKYWKLIFGISLVALIIIVVILWYIYQKNKKINLQYQKTWNKITSNIWLNIKNFTGKKEKYFINIDESWVKTKLYVNGILVYSDNIPSNWDEPITKFMKNGDNKIEINVTIIAKDPNDVSCSFRLGYISNLDLSEDIIYNDKKMECDDYLKKNGVQNFTYSIKTDLPFNLPWENGKKFENNKKTKEMLLLKYKEMQNILASLDEDRIKSFLKYKFERDSNWLYKNKEEIEKKYIKINTLNLSWENIEMLDILTSDELYLDISKDGHIAKLIEIDTETKKEFETLLWYDNENKLTISYPVWFMMTQGWEIIPIL